MHYLIATTFEVVHYIALQAVHYKPLQEVHLSRYNHLLELKYIKVFDGGTKKASSNCTLLELKFRREVQRIKNIICSNCTLLELK